MPRLTRSTRTIPALPALVGADDEAKQALEFINSCGDREQAKRPMRFPPPSKPPEAGKFGTIESWQRFETLIKTWNSDERLHARWLAVNWLWHEALVRAKLTPEESHEFTGSLKRYRRRDHDYLLGLRPLPKRGIGFSDVPPHVRKALAVRELHVDLPMSGELDTLPNALHLAADLDQPDRQVLKDIAAMVRRARKERQIRRSTQSGRRHSLAQLVEVLWLHDEKEAQHVKWEAVAWNSKTFPKNSAEKISKLCKRLRTTALQGQTTFVRAFL